MMMRGRAVSVQHPLDEVLQHLLGDREIGDDAVFHRPDRGDVAGCASSICLAAGRPPDHALAVRSAVLADRDDRRLVHDAFPAHRSYGPEVDRKIVRKILQKRTSEWAAQNFGRFRSVVNLGQWIPLEAVFIFSG
jgi:hypothetical protein